ncbi:hypothetical protein V6N12_068165 [Hibiscus sabdariffa]|uniref:Uncharacterized protein n=1 Tax=Hibiscus sabdariffa TaxID=183260 RepID=A0ABR2FPA2_9ROSI
MEVPRHSSVDEWMNLDTLGEICMTSIDELSFLLTLVGTCVDEWMHLFACLKVNPKPCGGISTFEDALFAWAETSHTLVEISANE